MFAQREIAQIHGKKNGNLPEKMKSYHPRNKNQSALKKCKITSLNMSKVRERWEFLKYCLWNQISSRKIVATVKKPKIFVSEWFFIYLGLKRYWWKIKGAEVPFRAKLVTDNGTGTFKTGTLEEGAYNGTWPPKTGPITAPSKPAPWKKVPITAPDRQKKDR